METPTFELLFLYAVDGLILQMDVFPIISLTALSAPFSFDIGISPWQEWSDYLNLQCSLSERAAAQSAHPSSLFPTQPLLRRFIGGEEVMIAQKRRKAFCI